MRAVISGFASAVGTPTLITEVLPPDVAGELVLRGQKLCPIADDELPLIEDAVRTSLTTTGTAAAAVHHVMVATETMTVSGSRAGHEAVRGRLYRTLTGLGLGHAPVTALTFGGCSAVMTALEYATLLVERGSAGCVLVVAVGRLRDGDSRVLAPAVSAIGDGVASCLVTADGPGWRFNWLLRRAFLRTAQFDSAEDFGPTLIALGRALRSLRKEAAKQADRDRGLPRAPRLVCNNYGVPTVRLFGSTLGVAESDIVMDNIPLLSHLGTPDILINLASLPAGVRDVLTLATGPADCVLASLERN